MNWTRFWSKSVTRICPNRGQDLCPDHGQDSVYDFDQNRVHDLNQNLVHDLGQKCGCDLGLEIAHEVDRNRVLGQNPDNRIFAGQTKRFENGQKPN